ncbi:UDP-glucosyltransferase 2 [Leptinotarsa decemlineata]|uniref:UDP-glucosyltransferase 2 n=1 Tax=Leptinotarsa decemlineata TaxID=7539 RepID=UPI000C254F3D|nr:UDP-glucuronosyltransferase 2B2-like [Leptinotarsa decemlineata]
MRLIIILIFTVIVTSTSKKILGIYSHPGKSHHIFGSIILRELAKRGHEVTMVSAYPLKKPISNYTDIYLDGFLEGLDDHDGVYLEMEKSPYHNMYYVLQMISYFTSKTLSHPKIQQLVESGQNFDLIIMDSFCKDAELYFGHIFKAPIILTASFGTQNFINYILNNPEPAAYVPGSGTAFTDEMGFMERLENVIYSWFIFACLHYNAIQQKRILRDYFGNVPSVDDLRSNIALVFVNSHPVFETPRPNLPNIVSVGGIHVEDAEPLPKDLQDYMDNSKEGVIFFSLGSHMKISVLPNETALGIIRALSRLPQNVLLKWELDQLPIVSDNIITRKWFPQRSILSHPNLKAIVTHGGLMTKIEAIHYGVPMVGIPLFGDQKNTVAHSVSEGIAIQIRLGELSEETLYNAITEIISNKSYQSNVEIRSEILRNQPMKPIDVAIYWSEHVMKFNGSKHLQNKGMRLYWFQNMLLDVTVFFAVVFGVISWLLIKSFLCIFRLLDGKGSTGKKMKTQ